MNNNFLSIWKILNTDLDQLIYRSFDRSKNHIHLAIIFFIANEVLELLFLLRIHSIIFLADILGIIGLILLFYSVIFKIIEYFFEARLSKLLPVIFSNYLYSCHSRQKNNKNYPNSRRGNVKNKSYLFHE